MTVSDLISDVAYRIGDPRADVVHPGYILRAMQRVYHRINMNKVLRKDFTVDFDDPGFSGSYDEKYVDLPKDFIAVFAMSKVYDYRPWEVWHRCIDYGESYIFSVYDGKMWFSDRPKLTVYYYSCGLELVADSEPEGDQVSSPEWENRYHQLLLYGTCLELSQDYKHVEIDARMYDTLLQEFITECAVGQYVTPHVIGDRSFETSNYD